MKDELLTNGKRATQSAPGQKAGVQSEKAPASTNSHSTQASSATASYGLPTTTDNAAASSHGFTDLVAQAVMDKLEEFRERDAFLEAVINRVDDWKDELGIEEFCLPCVAPAQVATLHETGNQSVPSAEQATARRSLYYKYEDDCFSSLTTRILVSCFDNVNHEGGLLELDFGRNTFRRIIRCDGSGITRYGDGYVVASRDRGLFVLDSTLNVEKNYPLPPLNLHGIACGPEGLIYLVETKHNRVGIYRMDPFERVDEIAVSPDTEDRNHVNDLCFRDGKLLLSMFSRNEVFKKNFGVGVFDGAIVEYDIAEKRPIREIATGLRMPHTLRILGGELAFCESFALGIVLSGTTIGQFLGYTRGMDFDGRFFYVGQSRVRHRNKHRDLNLSADAGIHVFDPKDHVSRFVQLPTSEIYGVMIID